ncbi:MAG: DNA polymerase III subunit beta [Desulfomonilaceae bacterium]|nr:DNA polymerase III subunit beta [Desulfomonilaceae bacterium]
MLFQIDRDSFLDGLTKTVPISEKRTPLPILSHILMNVDESHLVLTATDLEVGLKITSEAAVQEPGMLAVPSKKLYEIVRELLPGQVTVKSTETQRILIESGESVFELAGMDATDYPAWTTGKEVETAQVQASRLLYMIDKTMFAASTDDSRFNLNGILFEKEGEEHIKLVATDGHRLALIHGELGIRPVSNVIVPRKGLAELKRLLESLKGEISLGFEEKNLFVSTDRLMMTVRLIDGDFPDYRKVIPEPSDTIVRVPHSQFTHTLRRVAILTSDRNKGVNIKVSSGKMELKTTHPDLGTARDVMDVEYSGEEFLVIVNAAYLIEAVGVIDTDSVSIEFREEGAPVILRPIPSKDYFNLVMPMRK